MSVCNAGRGEWLSAWMIALVIEGIEWRRGAVWKKFLAQFACVNATSVEQASYRTECFI